MANRVVNVIGAGLAGSEAAWQIAERNVKVNLYEMRPKSQTPAHHTDQFAELVCSNSLRANSITNAVGLLKEEMRNLNSLIIKVADEVAIPAGGALAVDRERFSYEITKRLTKHRNVTVINEEITNIPSGPTIIATGPLTSDALSEELYELTGEDYLYFYDAAAPIVMQDSIDMDQVYLKSRYDKGEAAYLNCPLNEEQFFKFYNALIDAETVPLKKFEDGRYFEGCMPIEVLAKRGIKTLLFGPMKPVGLENPKTGELPYAVVQLRQDDAAGTLYNLVGFQTQMKWGPQRDVLQLIPGLENVEIARYGVMHRNTFINSPKLLTATYQFKKRPNLFFAGQITGVEGYVESAASGIVAGINAVQIVNNLETTLFPPQTVIGSMANYISKTSSKHFQPMNANFGLLPPLNEKIRNKRLRNEALANRSLGTIQKFVKSL